MKWITSVIVAFMLCLCAVPSDYCHAQSVRSLVIRNGEPRAMLATMGNWVELELIYADSERNVYWFGADIHKILFYSTYPDNGRFGAELLIEYKGEKLRQEIIKDVVAAPKSSWGLPKHYELLRYKKAVWSYDISAKTVSCSFGCYLDRDGDPLVCFKKGERVAISPAMEKVGKKVVAILEQIRHDPKTAEEIAAFRKATFGKQP